MSKIEVNTVEPQCGTTLTLGGSGDTVALGCGASQTGFGRTGTVDWITTPKVTGDSPVTAVTGKGYFLNTTAGAITINLPAGVAGSIVSLADYTGTWQTNNVTVVANGSEKIAGDTNDAILSTEGQSVTIVYVDGTEGWVTTADSTENIQAIKYVAATVSGACNTLTTAPCCANTKIAKFVSPGTFCVSQSATCAGNNVVSYLVVGGGGGGGRKCGGGGGGAGGYREVKSPAATGYIASPLDGYATPANRITVSATAYPITVGGGGAAAPANSTDGTVGVNTVFSTITGAGGGYGQGNPSTPGGGDGGSGGGGGNSGQPGGAGNTPPVSPAQGQNGGNGATGGGSYQEGGGGGGGTTTVGATAAGNAAGGNGGDGTTTTISATPTAYGGGAGGGTGGAHGAPVGAGGTGGGGAGGNCQSGIAAVAGTVNTGGGGGGGSGGEAAGAGGSGIVYIRYKFQ